MNHRYFEFEWFVNRLEPSLAFNYPLSFKESKINLTMLRSCSFKIQEYEETNLICVVSFLIKRSMSPYLLSVSLEVKLFLDLGGYVYSALLNCLKADLIRSLESKGCNLWEQKRQKHTFLCLHTGTVE
jgi:hypothetical protein